MSDDFDVTEYYRDGYQDAMDGVARCPPVTPYASAKKAYEDGYRDGDARRRTAEETEMMT